MMGEILTFFNNKMDIIHAHREAAQDIDESATPSERSRANRLLVVSLLVGAGSVVGCNELLAQPVMEQLATNAPAILKNALGLGVTLAGSWAINQKIFLDNIVRKWVAPQMATKIVGERKDEADRQPDAKSELVNQLVGKAAWGNFLGVVSGLVVLVPTTFNRFGSDVSVSPATVEGTGIGDRPDVTINRFPTVNATGLNAHPGVDIIRP